ncbi:MAG TPA: LuxR C-terminal-related transcriptional regulator, partial [Acidimicrobiales bacterium]|nr:LuxR C-terminal-related transcriptional regulator [Acidimicrobiales bacterium]
DISPEGVLNPQGASRAESSLSQVEFDVEFTDSGKAAIVASALQLLGCRTESLGMSLHVWLPAHPAAEHLSAREFQLVCLASKGHTDKEIAAIVGLSIFTIRSYWVRICHKLSAHNRTHAVSIVFAGESMAGGVPSFESS